MERGNGREKVKVPHDHSPHKDDNGRVAMYRTRIDKQSACIFSNG